MVGYYNRGFVHALVSKIITTISSPFHAHIQQHHQQKKCTQLYFAIPPFPQRPVSSKNVIFQENRNPTHSYNDNTKIHITT